MIFPAFQTSTTCLFVHYLSCLAYTWLNSSISFCPQFFLLSREFSACQVKFTDRSLFTTTSQITKPLLHSSLLQSCLTKYFNPALVILSMSKIPRIDIHTHILPSNLPEKYYENYSPDETYVHFKQCASVPAPENAQHVASCCKNVKMYKGEKFFREVEPNCFDPIARLDDMTTTTVDVQVLSTVPVMFSYWDNVDDAVDLSQRINNELAEICDKYPNKFIALATLPMSHPDQAVVELERVMKLPGMVGVEIGSNVQKLQLSHAKFEPIWEACARLNAAVFVHPWNMPREKYVSKYWLPYV